MFPDLKLQNYHNQDRILAYNTLLNGVCGPEINPCIYSQLVSKKGDKIGKGQSLH